MAFKRSAVRSRLSPPKAMTHTGQMCESLLYPYENTKRTDTRFPSPRKNNIVIEAEILQWNLRFFVTIPADEKYER